MEWAHLRRTLLQTRFALPESQDCFDRLKKSGQTNITTRSEVNREIRCRMGRCAGHFHASRAWHCTPSQKHPSLSRVHPATVETFFAGQAEKTPAAGAGRIAGKDDVWDSRAGPSASLWMREPA
jgi:hypothetical protein